MSDAVAQIKKILGSGYIDDPSQMQPYLTSWRNGWTGKAQLIALPSSPEILSEIVKICHEQAIPLVPQGGNTGLVGGSVPLKGNEIIINLSRMKAIRALDTTASTITVEAGVVLQDLQEKAAEAGFLFPLSMASEGSAEIGGAISTNAGGTAVLRYGNMRDLVVGVEAVLANGQIYSSLHKLPKDNTGYDLGRYFIGAEGTLAIITAATLKLFPALNQKVTAVLALNDVSEALQLLKDFRAEAYEYLTAFEIISQKALKLVVKHIPAARIPGQENAAFYLLLELASASQATPLRDMLEALVGKALEQGKILDAVVAENAAQAKQFWHLREHVSEALRKEGEGLHFDISLPLAQIPLFLKDMDAEILKVAPDIQLAPFGHIGDGNLHYNMCFTKTPPDFATLKKKIQDLVYKTVKQRGGSISAEHGIGIERKAELLNYKSAAEIDVMRTIKKAIDPKNLMNPGKIFD
ncbi:MAG: FAD-binding oxidoreductase [Alphaproteobacteria bacterium]